MLAAHKTERGPGQLPAEGVVLIGVDYELQRRMSERLPLLPRDPEAIIGAPNFSAPDIAASKLDAPVFSAPITPISQLSETLSDAPVSGAPNFSAPPFYAPAVQSLTTDPPPHFTSNDPNRARKLDPPEPTLSPPEFNLRDLLIRRSGTKTYTIHAVSRIEDVFTASERDLLRWLWEKGRPVPGIPRIRLVSGPNGEGARRFATQAGMIYNTFKNLTRALSTKLAVDIVKPERNLPTIYAVYHYSAILQRQRDAGLAGALHKNGGGRELVNADAQPACRRPDLTIDELEQILSALKFGASISSGAAPKIGAVPGTSGAPNFTAPIRNKEYTSQKEYTSPSSPSLNVGAPTFVIDALFHRTGRTDIDAARMITKGCLEANPTIQPEEIAQLIRTMQIPPNITNPVGLLIRSLPGRCAPDSIANYRERWRREADQEQRRREQELTQSIETARSILDGVAKGEEWDAATVEWAQSVLTAAGGGRVTTG